MTKIREEEFGEEAQTGQSIIGLDVSGMHLSIMMQDQCTGNDKPFVKCMFFSVVANAGNA